MVVGIAIGVGFMICIILAFMVGYGMADMKHKQIQEDNE